MISSQYDRNLDLFFDAFENLERNESYAKSWLMEARHLKNQRVDYIEQLKAVIQDMSVILNRSKCLRKYWLTDVNWKYARKIQNKEIYSWYNIRYGYGVLRRAGYGRGAGSLHGTGALY